MIFCYLNLIKSVGLFPVQNLCINIHFCPVGEPLNKEAWQWYHSVVGEKRCTVVDTYWQTGK